METNRDLKINTPKTSKKTVDLQKMMEIVEGGFNTQDINAAFDYDLVSSDDDSSLTESISSEESESENSIDYEKVTVIYPTPKKRKLYHLVSTNVQGNDNNTCIQRCEQHVQGVSGINQQNIPSLSEQPTSYSQMNTTKNTSPHPTSAAEEHPSCEHDKMAPSNTEAEHVVTISLDTEFTPEPNQHESTNPDEENIVISQNENTTLPLLLSTTDIAPSPQQYPSNNNIHLLDETDPYYIIEDNPPASLTTNQPIQQTNIEICENDKDIQNGWHKITHDRPQCNPPFADTPGLNFDTPSREPEAFFNELFDQRMFTILAEETNKYARQQISRILDGRDQIEHHSHRRHARLGTWRDLNEEDIKIFIAHILVMSSVKKPALHNYWSTQNLSRTPFFGTYISRNKFQDILWNLHVADTTHNPPPGCPNHDALAKVRPLVTMCQRNFRLWYTPSECLAVDESTLGFKVKYLTSISPPPKNIIYLIAFSTSMC